MKPWVATWIGRIRTLYRLGKTSEDRIKNREALLDHRTFTKTEAKSDLRRSEPLPSPAQKAVKRFLHPWDGLPLFLDRPEISLDNKASERVLRSQVTGRKNFGGAGALWLTLVGPSRRLDLYPLRHMDKKRDQQSHRPHRRPHRLRDPGPGPR